MKMEQGAKLGRIERIFYYTVWIGAVFYSIYHVFLMKKYFSNYSNNHYDFRPGWSWIGGNQDTADYEWQIWIPLLFKLVPWIIVHLLGSLLIKHTSKLMPVNVKEKRKCIMLCIWYITISLAFLYHYVGILGILCILIQPCISSLLLAINSKNIIWITNLLLLTAINFAKSSETVYQYFVHLEYEEYCMLMIAICWTQLRNISFVMDNYHQDHSLELKTFFMQLLRNTAFNLYLPTLFLGPVILYRDFFKSIDASNIPWTFKRFLRSSFNILRFIFWLYFTEFALHFVFVNALQYHPEIISKMGAWAFYGFGYCMGQYFLNKYVVIYGLCSEVARIDDIEAPPTPKCIGRIHLYSDMWKHFDVGLYKFLFKYIYLPVTNSSLKYRKIFGSFMCFAFIFMWHGLQQFIFVWSVMNFVGIMIESLAKYVSKTTKYKDLQDKYLSDRWKIRFQCAISAPLLAMSAVSNFYFFGGIEVGNMFILRLFQESPLTIIILSFCLYCCCQVSTDLKNYEKKRTNLQDHNTKKE